MSSGADPKPTVAIAKDGFSTRRQRHPMKGIVGHRLSNDSTDAAKSNRDPRAVIALRHRAAPADWCRQMTGRSRASIATGLLPIRPTCCRRHPRTRTPLRCRDFRHCHNRWGRRRGLRRGFPPGPRDRPPTPPAPQDRPPTRFRRDPPAGREHCGAQAPDIQSVDRSRRSSIETSSSSARRWPTTAASACHQARCAPSTPHPERCDGRFILFPRTPLPAARTRGPA